MRRLDRVLVFAFSGFCLLNASCGKGTSSSTPSSDQTVSPASRTGAGNATPVGATPSPNTVGSAAAAARPQGATADNPDAEMVALLYYSLSGQTAPVDDWAKQDFQYTANEFDRSKKTETALATYKTKMAFASTVGHLALLLNSNLSDYDDKHGEFYVDAFSPSSVFDFPYQGSTYKITFVNGDQAQHWKLPDADAASVIDRNSNGHNVSVSANVDLVGVQPAADGGTIIALVRSYTVESAGRREPLGTVTVTPSAIR